MKKLLLLDERGTWQEAITAAAKQWGYATTIVTKTESYYLHDDCYHLGFMRPHADPAVLQCNQEIDWPDMHDRCQVMIQDRTQVECYENKRMQWGQWKHLMPGSLDLRSRAEVQAAAFRIKFPLVSKADQGASSVNVRYLPDVAALLKHADEVFVDGVSVNHCSGGHKSVQKDYLFIQEFIPHDYTWRVNRIGDCYAIFRRHDYSKDKPLSRTGHTDPVTHLDARMRKLLDFAELVTHELGSKWVALDIIDSGTEPMLLETSLAWPWPSPGECSLAPFYRKHEGTWGRMAVHWGNGLWNVMFRSVEQGEFE